MQKKRKKEFWTLYHYQSMHLVCRRHTQLARARKQAKRCKEEGNGKHEVVGVTFYE